jgi:Mce-associated membrane protein
MEEPVARSAGPELRMGAVRISWATALLLVVLVAAVGFGANRALAWRDAHDSDADGRAAVSAAKAEVTALTSISARTSDADVRDLLEGATAEFRTELERQADRFREALTRARVTSTGKVVSAGLAELDDDKAVVLVAASGSVKNNRTRKAEPRSYRMRVDLRRVEGDWLVAGLEFVG